MGRVYACSSYCYKAAVRSGEGVLMSLFVHSLFWLHCVIVVYVCSSCCNKAALRFGEVVLLSLFVHCLF